MLEIQPGGSCRKLGVHARNRVSSLKVFTPMSITPGKQAWGLKSTFELTIQRISRLCRSSLSPRKHLSISIFSFTQIELLGQIQPKFLEPNFRLQTHLESFDFRCRWIPSGVRMAGFYWKLSKGRDSMWNSNVSLTVRILLVLWGFGCWGWITMRRSLSRTANLWLLVKT